jgi:hypothetical protein
MLDRRMKSVGAVSSTILFAAVICSGCVDNAFQQAEKQTARESSSPSQPAQQPVYKYKILSESPAQDGSVHMMRASILVPDGLSKMDLASDLRAAAQEICGRQQVDSMLLFAYKPDTDTDGVYSAGRYELTPDPDGGSPEIALDLTSDYFAAKDKDGEIPLGGKDDAARLTKVKMRWDEKTRRRIYFDVGEAEDEADKEADRRVPNPDPGSAETEAGIHRQGAVRNDLEDEYRHHVARHFHLTDKEIEVVGDEGSANHWPAPG